MTLSIDRPPYEHVMQIGGESTLTIVITANDGSTVTEDQLLVKRCLEVARQVQALTRVSSPNSFGRYLMKAHNNGFEIEVNLNLIRTSLADRPGAFALVNAVMDAIRSNGELRLIQPDQS